MIKLKRLILLKASTAFTAPIFNPKSIASAGRFDIVIRSLLSLKNGSIEEKEFIAILEGPPTPPLAMIVRNEGFKMLPDSEIDCARVIINYMKCKQDMKKEENIISFEKIGFRKILLEKINMRYKFFYLHESGKDIRKIIKHIIQFPKVGFIVGDHIGIDTESERFIEELGIPKVSLGPIPYLASHCIVIVNEELDRALL